MKNNNLDYQCIIKIKTPTQLSLLKLCQILLYIQRINTTLASATLIALERA